MDAMTALGNGLSAADYHEKSLTVREAKLSMLRRLGAPEHSILIAQSNLAGTYRMLNRDEDVLSTMRDVYHGYLKLFGEQNRQTLMVANNYAVSLGDLRRFKEAKSLLQKTMPVARRVLGEGHDLTLAMRWIYAGVLYEDASATLEDLREAVRTLEDAGQIARRVFGGANPLTKGIERELRDARAALRARETPPPGSA